MNSEERELLKEKVLKRHELYKINNNRFLRLVKDPIRTLFFYVLAIIARIHPYKVRVKTLWGDKMTYFLPEGQAILYYGFFEANLTIFLLNFLKKGDCFLDVGAHVGYYTVLCSRLVEDSGRVYSFEPTPRTFSSLKINTKESGNVIINNLAVLNEEKEINFIDYGPKFSAFNGFRKRTSDDTKFLRKNAIEIKVKTTVLDDYCKKHNITPTFIKIDAEGAEHLILEGMGYIMKELKPVISIEVAGEDEWKDNCRKSIDILLTNNYIAYECDVNGKLSLHKAKDKYVYDNLIFIHKDNAIGLAELVEK